MKLTTNKAGQLVMSVNATDLKKIDAAITVLRGVARMEEDRSASASLIEALTAKRAALSGSDDKSDKASRPMLPGTEE